MNSHHTPPSDLEYWSQVMSTSSSDSELNSFSFEEKYKIIEYAYNKIGIYSKIPLELLQHHLMNEDPWEDICNEALEINKIAYWIFGFWGSYSFIKMADKLEWTKPSNQIWYYDGEQDEIDYLSYASILHQMRETNEQFKNWEEFFDKESNTFKISFEYNDNNVNWDIVNESPGWLNGIVFKLYTDLCVNEYIENGNYFMMMEGQGGYLMYLIYEAEEYLRKLWNFPKLNRQGQMKTLNDYGKLYEPKNK